jgi:hypothetical protein
MRVTRQRNRRRVVAAPSEMVLLDQRTAGRRGVALVTDELAVRGSQCRGFALPAVLAARMTRSQAAEMPLAADRALFVILACHLRYRPG